MIQANQQRYLEAPPRQDAARKPSEGQELAEPSTIMRQHLVDSFDAAARCRVIEVAPPGVKSHSGNRMFHVQPAGEAPMLAKVLAGKRVLPQELAAFAHEQAGCLLAAQVGVGADVLHCAPRLLVTRYIVGDNLQGGKTVHWPHTNRALHQLRKFHVAAHDPAAVPQAGALVAKYQKAAAGTRALGLVDPERAAELDAQVARVQSLLEKLSAGSTTLVHGDFRPGNVRIGFDGSAHLIDLERWGRGEPAADLAHFAAGARLNLRDMRRLLRAYGGKDTPNLLARLRLCVFLIHAEHHMLWLKWNATEDWCKGTHWGPAKVTETAALMERGLRHVARYERSLGRRPSCPDQFRLRPELAGSGAQ